MAEAPPRDRLESALLFLGRDQAVLAQLLRLILPPVELAGLVKAAGRRPPRSDDAEAVVHAVLRIPKARRALLDRLLAFRPTEEAPPGKALKPDMLSLLRREVLLAALWEGLLAGQEEGWQELAERLHDWREHLAPAANPAGAPPAAAKSARPAKAPPLPEGESLKRDILKLEERLQAALAEVTEFQRKAGRDNARIEKLEGQLAGARTSLRTEKRRVTEWKQKLEEAVSASDREKELKEQLDKLRKSEHVVQQKFQILQEEVDDLHGVLKDMDRYMGLAAEEVPSFHERPLQPEEVELGGRLARRAERKAPPLRVLVVGGGEPQFRHKGKLEEYAGRLGFHSDWRMAEYQSWHRELDRLARDMRTRFDAMVILHWNRTTFTRKAREICNQAGQKPCVTCHYEGFTSLRRTLQETLRQLLAAEEDRAA